MRASLTIRPVLIASVLLVAAGCGTSPKSATTAPAAEGEQYVKVAPVGSRVGVRVKKGERAVNRTAPTGTVSGEQASSLAAQEGLHPIPGDGGR